VSDLVSPGKYHHGIVIKAFREAANMTQPKLAELWPKEGGVSVRYVQDIESGVKHITDQGTLRKLGEILDIPLWQFGLSEYDPFHPTSLPGRGASMYDETLDTIECLVRQTWRFRSVALMDHAKECLTRVNSHFAYFQKHLPPPLKLEPRFLRLFAQVQRLNAVTSVEYKAYKEAIATYEKMLQTAIQIHDPVTIALALMSLGTELERTDEKHGAVNRLEEARDVSFGASKHIAAFVHAYLARAYASSGDSLHFQRAVDTSFALASSLNGTYGDGTDFVFGKLSSVLAERSWGYLELREPQKTLDMKEEIAAQIDVDQDMRLLAWIPLDWARANLLLGDVERSIADARDFYTRVTAMKSPHAVSRAYSFVQELEAAGFGDVQAVRDFKHELIQAQQEKHE
jgi:transcriptional regulator with XRE-family HTH domain